MGIKCARTGCRVESNAREMKLASRIFSFKKVFFLINFQQVRREEYATTAVQSNRRSKTRGVPVSSLFFYLCFLLVAGNGLFRLERKTNSEGFCLKTEPFGIIGLLDSVSS
jgi:hypothetical protein